MPPQYCKVWYCQCRYVQICPSRWQIEVVVVGGGAGRAECGAGGSNDAGMFGGGSLCCGKISKDVVAQGIDRALAVEISKQVLEILGDADPSMLTVLLYISYVWEVLPPVPLMCNPLMVREQLHYRYNSIRFRRFGYCKYVRYLCRMLHGKRRCLKCLLYRKCGRFGWFALCCCKPMPFLETIQGKYRLFERSLQLHSSQHC